MSSADPVASTDPVIPGFLRGGGEMGARIRAFDWAAHPFGPPHGWPAALKLAVGMCLRSSFPTAIYWGPEFRIVHNDGWSVMAESYDTALGQPASVVRPEIWPVLGPQFAQIMADGDGMSFVAQRLMLVRGGRRSETFWTYNSSPIMDDDGVPLGVINQGLEVTAQVQAEGAVRESQARLDLALDAAGNIGTWEWDLANGQVVGDERIARLYGLDPALAARGAAPATFLAHIHPDDAAPTMRHIEESFESGASLNLRYRLMLPDVGERWVAVQGRTDRDGEGRVSRFAGVTIDITEPVQREQALRDAKEEREFILSLVERQRAQSNADDVMQLTAEAVGRLLNVDRAGFFQVNDETVIEFGPCWVGGRLPPLVGSVPSATFGAELGEVVRVGRTLVFGTPGDAVAPREEALELTGTRAGISVPLLRNDRWEAAFYLSHAEPRDWTPGEIALVEEVAELSWDAVARVRAVAGLRALNADLAGEVAARTAERDRLWEVSNDLLGIQATDGRWLAVNPAWTRVLGWEVDEIVGRDSSWMHHPADRANSAAEIAYIAAGGEPRPFENRFRTRDGDYRLLAWQTVLVGDRLYTNARDVTEQRRQQAALLAAEERTRMVLDAMDGVGVWTYDIAADRFHSDASFAALHGFDPEKVGPGRSMAEVLARIHSDDLPKMHEAIARARETGGDGENEYRLILPDGHVRWIMSRNHILRDAHGAPQSVVGVGVDVSRQRELEDRLRQSQKMEAVGQLTGGLAHDFNNLLTGISGALEMMQLRLKQGRIGDLPRYIGAAQTGAGRAAALTHRLLAFSRRQPLDPRPIEIGRLIAGMEDLVRGTLGPAVVLDIDLAADAWPVLVDPNQLENALLNLCINARDAMPEGGRVTITTGNEWLDEAAATERDLPPGAYATLCVVDTGTGMAPEVVARAFDPFYTTKPLGQGTGLGLSMIYGFVRQSGGQVRISTVLGEGTTMCLLLPRHYGAVAADDGSGTTGAVAIGTGETVLVVDDEPTVRMLVTELLGELGYHTLQASDGAEAVALLRSDARIDLLVTDVGLPGGMNGRQVADAARDARAALPVLFITGYAENAVVGDGPLDPGMALIAKPFTMEALAERVRAMLGRG